MALTSSKRVLELSEYEYCYNTEYTYPCSSGGKMKMYIPKLMSDIGFQNPPRQLPYIFSGDDVFGNASDCKPGSAKSFMYQNYIEVELMHNVSNWEHIIDGIGKVPLKTKFLCSFINGDTEKSYFTTNL